MSAGAPPKTLLIHVPADLLEKLRWEAETLWSDRAPIDIRLRTYLVINCAITAWQIKDCVYNALRTSNRLHALDELAGRPIKSAEDLRPTLKPVVFSSLGFLVREEGCS